MLEALERLVEVQRLLARDAEYVLDALGLEALHEQIRRLALARSVFRNFWVAGLVSGYPDPFSSMRRLVPAHPSRHSLLARRARLRRAKARFTIRGAGFGHGVGMSQYGAYGFAQHGADVRRRSCATTTRARELGTTDPAQTVRVLLQSTGTASFSGASRPARASSTRRAPTACAATAPRRSTCCRPRGKRIATFSAPLQVSGPGRRVALGGVGQLPRHRSSSGPTLFGGVNAINAVSLEDYVAGVVARESPSSWPAEALKAQAVAARTYAITTSKAGAGFDHYADTRSQVYGGVAAETESTNAAVAATRGQVVTYEGEPVVTFFFSTSGGRTENVENTNVGAGPQAVAEVGRGSLRRRLAQAPLGRRSS